MGLQAIQGRCIIVVESRLPSIPPCDRAASSIRLRSELTAQRAPLRSFHAARLSRLRAGDPAGGGRPGRPGAGLPRPHATACRRSAPQVALRACLIAGAILFGAALVGDWLLREARHHAARVPHRRRAAAVLGRVRDGVRRAHRAPDARRRAGDGGACAQHRGVPARHSADGRARRHHRDGAARRPGRRPRRVAAS